MALTADQLAAAKQTLEDLLNPLKSEGARVTLSPLLGLVSKVEFQAFYEGSSYTTPEVQTFNGAFKQLRTLRYRCFVSLKDLRDPFAAQPILEQSKTLLVGVQLFGAHPQAAYEGALYATADQYSQIDKEGGWIYQQNLQCQIEEYLPMPS